MPTEHAAVRVVHKPWGVGDLKPWSEIDGSRDAVGELWFERAGENVPTPALLLKLLFTSQPLSIQVHPDDTFARAMGMPNGKSEAWYILSAEPDAQIGAGLKHRVTAQQLRASIQNGSIAELIQWRSVAAGDVVYIPAGTIHAIGAGIVLAEIQQRSDATFRLFDYDRHRELHVDDGVAAAHPWPLRTLGNSTLGNLTPGNSAAVTANRTVLVASKHFVLERIAIPEGSSWALFAEPETWMLILDGHAATGLAAASIGEAIFIGGGRASIEVGDNGLSALIAYPASRPIDVLLQNLDDQPGELARPAAYSVPQFAVIAEART
ncbi:class I mannose-6-phosphate isomerase [Bradyrhizobium betae]|uniref:Mannose-6-phosphate isomerase n=1 Tax=Bradyrhizobium betae TaxID=244734 RepID=A0A4Q1UR70_9BRAD|nr:class I mannose-6-phosphate isomerase [Bradyrhizobium betae]RXT40186.1 mannose-6-phosphate isomerase [Bradyrhizobium betae]